MKIYNIIASIFLSSLLVGCNDNFLDRRPEAISDENYWNTTDDLEAYANSFYSILPSGLTSNGDGNSDDQVPHSRPSYFWDEYPIPANGGGWAKSDWARIRELNHFMNHYTKAGGDQVDINQYVGEVRFFRAMQYSAKIRTFGDVPWFDKDLKTTDIEILYGPKTKRDLVMDKIIEDFDFAIQWLPDNPKAGRIGKNVARHLKARTCLHEGTYYKYHTQMNLQQKSTSLLALAAQTAKDIIETGKYEIYTTGKPEKDYYEMFLIDDKSSLKEAILPVGYLKDLHPHNTSRSLSEAKTGFSKDFVNNYLCSDGLPIALSQLYKGDKTMEAETANRDPRLSQTIHNPKFPIRISDGGDSIFIAEEDYISDVCYTGYRIRKYYSPLEKDNQAKSNTYDGIAYRYAETLLIYAEAKAELGTISLEDLDITINKLRERAGMPPMTLEVGFSDPNWTNWGYAITPLLQEIRRERRVELAGEGLRLDDLKRWKAGQIADRIETYTGKWVENENKYAEVYPNYLGKRMWNDRLYLYPIPTGEIQKNENLLPQNPGWN
ncbi:hypothetical protein AwDysgo_07720 [Bacteroidales bacterium]|nr:hypothetical protein AwDysgo_07720 [Bacteroidales bacterium]